MNWREPIFSLWEDPITGSRSGDLRLVYAYKAVLGRDDEHATLVLADLARSTGYYQYEPAGSDPSQYQAGYEAGRRAVFGRLLNFLSLSDEQMRVLEEAARAEAEQI